MWNWKKILRIAGYVIGIPVIIIILLVLSVIVSILDPQSQFHVP